MNTPHNTPLYLSTLGHMAWLFQVSVQEVQAALDRIDAKPVLVINGLAHYSADDHNRALLAIAPKIREVPNG
jgi:hypothetical protein